MVDGEKILKSWGPQHVAKALELVFDEADKYIVGLPVQPSLIGNVACSVIGALGDMISPALKDSLMIWGGHHSTALWDYVVPYIAPMAGLKLNPHRPEGLSPGGEVYGARWGPYQAPVSAGAGRPGLEVAVGTRPVTRAVKAAVTVGPYAGGLTAPKFIPGALYPKFQLGG